jgi:hypothetical protein
MLAELDIDLANWRSNIRRVRVKYAGATPLIVNPKDMTEIREACERFGAEVPSSSLDRVRITADVMRAYKRKALEVHPDRWQHEPHNLDLKQRQFTQIQADWNVIQNWNQRLDPLKEESKAEHVAFVHMVNGNSSV